MNKYWVMTREGFPGGSVIKKALPIQETWVQSLGWEDPLEKEMATHSSVLAWEIPWTEGPDGPWSMGLQCVRHDLVTKPPPVTRELVYTKSEC